MMEFALLSLTVFRLARMVTKEEGPFEMFSRWRSYLGQQAAIQDRYTPLRQTTAELFNCPYCLSVWLAGIVYLFRRPFHGVSAVFGIAGLQTLLQSLDDKLVGE